MTILNENRRRTAIRLVNNREPLGATISDNTGSSLDLTGLSFTFRMINVQTGEVKVDDQIVAVIDAANGKVQYEFAAEDVDSPGLFACYFKDDSNPPREWPFDGAKMLLRVVSRTDR